MLVKVIVKLYYLNSLGHFLRGHFSFLLVPKKQGFLTGRWGFATAFPICSLSADRRIELYSLELYCRCLVVIQNSSLHQWLELLAAAGLVVDLVT